MLEEVADRHFKDTEEMVRQEGVDEVWKELSGNMEEEFQDKYKVEEAKKGAYKGRGDPLEWRIVKKYKKYQPRRWSGDCWARIFSRFGECDLQRNKR